MRYTQAEQALIDNPNTMAEICAHVGAGGSLQGLCDTWNRVGAAKDAGIVRHGYIWAWIAEDEARRAAWVTSTNQAVEFDRVRLADLYRAIAFGDVRGLLDDEGRVIPVSKWPAELAMMVQGLDVAEMFESGEANAKELVGILKKIKLADRLKAGERLEQLNGFAIQRHQVTGKVTLEDLVVRSTEEKPSA